MQRSYFVVQMTTTFDSFDTVRAEASDLMAQHISRSRQLHKDGVLVMAGAFMDPPGQPVQTMGVLTSREAAEAYAQDDPFVIAGHVRSWVVREWANMFAA